MKNLFFIHSLFFFFLTAGIVMRTSQGQGRDLGIFRRWGDIARCLVIIRGNRGTGRDCCVSGTEGSRCQCCVPHSDKTGLRTEKKCPL